MISNCGHDERGKYSGGKAGDQTGTEWQVINWYNRPWKCVLRHPDAATRKLIAQMAKAAAVNNMVGYCQSHRDFNPRSREGSDINFHQKVLFSLSKNCLIHLFFITNFLN